ncbi:MAG: hypothetical protein EBQ58_02405 [Betaproteobacteria bacterium]|nr:hypothetical protein [Betaproteobacteria bacterium]
MKYIISEKNFEPHVRIRKWFYRLVFWMLALLLLMALIRHSDWSLTFSRLMDVPKTVLVICTLGWLSSFLFRAFRFKGEWHAHGKISLWDSLSLTFLHNAAVILVPFRVGELGYPVLVQKLLNVSLQQCIRSLLWLRLQDGIVLLSLAFLLLPFLSTELRIAGLLFFVTLCLATQKWWLRLLRSRHFLIRQVRAFLHQRSSPWGWFWSAANWMVKLMVVSLMLSNLTGLDTLQTLRGALAGELSALLPLTGPAGLGTYEAGVWTGLGLTWQEMKGLMGSVLLTHLFFLGISLLGAVVAVSFNALALENFKPKQGGVHV